MTKEIEKKVKATLKKFKKPGLDPNEGTFYEAKAALRKVLPSMMIEIEAKNKKGDAIVTVDGAALDSAVQVKVAA